jgi:hypothetical protein
MTDNHGEFGRNPDPTQVFLDACSAVAQYNSDHVGPTGITFTTMMDLYRRSKPDYEAPPSTPQEIAEIHQKRVVESYEDTLASLGIKLDVQPPTKPYDGITGYPIDVDKDLIPPVIVLKVGEAELFGQTIERLNPKDEEREHIQNSINGILNNTLKGVKDIYRGLAGEDEASTVLERYEAEMQMDALIDLNPVLVAYNYGDEKFRQELAACMIRHQDNTLEEYVRAEDMGLLSADGASAWVLYMDANSLENAWFATVDLLRDLRSKERSKEGGTQFYSELFAKVKGDFNRLLAMLQDPGYSAALTVGTDPETRMQSLDEVAERLKEMWSNDFTLESLLHPETDKPDKDIK